MTLQKWSELLFDYYRKRNNSARFVLHITFQDLIDYAKEVDVEIANGRNASSFEEEFVKKDFVRKFWRDKVKGNENLDDFQQKINQIVDYAIASTNYDVLLPVLALLIMPICENDDLVLHGKNYYGHLYHFLVNNKFISDRKDNIEKWSRSFLQKINLDIIWKKIDIWAKEKNINLDANVVVYGNGATQYVSSLMKESLLSPSKIQRFKLIFDKSGLVPKANIDDNRLLSAFKSNYQCLGISDSKFNALTKTEDCRGYLFNILRSEYEQWDGTTKIKEKDRNTGKDKTVSDNTCYPLLLYMDYNEISNKITKIALHLYCNDVDDMEYMTFVCDSDGKELPKVYIKNNGYANRPFEIDEKNLNDVFANQEVFCIHEQDNESLKGRFVVTDYYLMKRFNNRYVATNEYVKGEFYFALIRNKVLSKFDSWLKDNDAELVDKTLFGGLYSAYRIRKAKADLIIFNNLRFKTDIKCKGVNNFELKTDTETDAVCLSKHFTAQFEITGVDVSKDRVYAVSVDGDRVSSELEYNHNVGLWVLSSDKYSLNREFTLFLNETPIPYCKKFKFIDFVIPHSFDELSLDKWGMIGSDTLTEGLSLPDNVAQQNLTNWKNMSEYMSKAEPKSLESADYTDSDYLLYAITTASFDRRVISVDWLRNIMNRLATEYENANPDFGKYAFNNTLADYFRMGYINYSYTNDDLCITANRPTLILMPPEFEQETKQGVGNKTMVFCSCVDKEYRCLLTGGRTPDLVKQINNLQTVLNFKVVIDNTENSLMPQTIFIYAKQRVVFHQLADNCNLLYQDNIYANALVKSLPSVDDYYKIILEEGTEKDMFGVKNFRTIDYKCMSELYPQKLAEGKVLLNSEIDKKKFDENNDVVTFFPRTEDESSVLIKDGRMIAVDKYWGHFLGMLLQKAKVLQHNEEQAKIFMPFQIRLPLLYARALTLTTGKTPSSVSGSRAYSVADNPFTRDCNAQTILTKLGQS